MAFLAALGPWAWVIAGLALMGVELFAPGLFFIWLGLAALGTGVVVGMFGLGWTSSALAFAAFAVGSVLAGRALMRRKGAEPDAAQGLNALSRDLIGKTLRLDRAIVDGEGRVRVGDTVWRALGEDAPAGEKVRVVGLEGTALRVERL
jgi:membrane protein implicated in regulation of membrane protease activity